jgi:hypothetical protein
MSISTEVCKEAIIAFVETNQAKLAKEFIPPVDMSPALLVKNWKRTYKAKVGKYSDYPQGTIERTFDCKPYDDQLRGYTYDNGTEIIAVEVMGE